MTQNLSLAIRAIQQGLMMVCDHFALRKPQMTVDRVYHGRDYESYWSNGEFSRIDTAAAEALQ